jgi:hypothetical protein
LSDLGVDTAHLSWSPALARWGETLVMTVTVFNSGWVASPSTSVHFDILLKDETVLDPPAQADIAVSGLNPRQTQQITATLELPLTPPSGYESQEYAFLRVSVDPSDTISENTEANNLISSPFMVQPLPTTAGLFLIVKDTTQTSRNGGVVPLNTGTASLSGNDIEREILLKDYLTVLGDNLPIGSSVVTYTVSWGGDGYSKPDSVDVGIVRNSIDPYRIDFNNSNTVVLETNSWGSLSGTITELGSGNPLTATVRIEGQGINITTETTTSGQFSTSTEDKLGKLIPGQYDIYVSAVNHARENGTITISALGTHTWNRALDKTEYAYVRGSAINQFGRPVPSAGVDACGYTTTTNSDGSFDIGEVHISCTLLEITKAGYATVYEPLSLTAGLEEYMVDIEMSFDPSVEIIQDEGSLASWKQDESTADLLPDPPEDAEWYEMKLFDTFAEEFWPSYRVQVWWGTYEYFVDAAYTGPVEDRHLYQVQLRLIPTSFESHLVSGDTSVELQGGITAKFTLGSFQMSGVMSAMWVIEAWLVDADSNDIIQIETNPVEGGGAWIVLDDQTRTYDFGGVTIDDWENAELWLFIKVGKNEGGSWTSSPILRGWHFDQQVLRLKLNEGVASGEYMITNYPTP